MAYTSLRNLEPFTKRCLKLCPAATLLKYASKPTPESYKFIFIQAITRKQYMVFKIISVNGSIPPHVQSGKQQWYAHMCVKVYRTYPYYIILLGSIAVVYFIGAIILAHTHIHAFTWMVTCIMLLLGHCKKYATNLNCSLSGPALLFLCMCCLKPCISAPSTVHTWIGNTTNTSM